MRSEEGRGRVDNKVRVLRMVEGILGVEEAGDREGDWCVEWFRALGSGRELVVGIDGSGTGRLEKGVRGEIGGRGE